MVMLDIVVIMWTRGVGIMLHPKIFLILEGTSVWREHSFLIFYPGKKLPCKIHCKTKLQGLETPEPSTASGIEKFKYWN